MTIVVVFCGYERWVIMENEYLLDFFWLGHGGARTICGYLFVFFFCFFVFFFFFLALNAGFCFYEYKHSKEGFDLIGKFL